MTVEDQKLDGIISMFGGVLNPYAGGLDRNGVVHYDNAAGTDHVWFYEMQGEGKSLDEKRTDLLRPVIQGRKPTCPTC